MWSSRLFWKMFLALAALVVLAVAGSMMLVSRWQEDQLMGQTELRLRDAAILLGEHVVRQLSTGPSEALQDEVRRLGSALDTRFTLLDAEGEVLADSEQATLADVAKMENHRHRQEFVAAARDGLGQAQRQSGTVGVPYLYVALRVDQDGKTVGFVRAAQALDEVHAQVVDVRRFIALVGLALGVTGLAVSLWLTWRIVQPVRELIRSADQIATGDYPQRVDVAGTDELGQLARSFEHMSRELGSRERQLRESVQRQATVLGGMIEGVIAVDRGQRVLFANVAAGRKLRFSPEDVEGLPLLEVVRSHELREIVEQALQSREHRHGEIQWKSDVQLTLEVHATPLPGVPCPGVVLVLHDVTDLKRLEGMRQQFIANVSHELKTPLSSIRAYTETLLGGALEDSAHARTFLTRIDDQAGRLQELILDMLSLARLESGQAPLELSNVLVAEVVAECVRDHEAQAAAGNLTLVNEVGKSALVVRADDEALLQVLNNLVDNAIKYTPAGGTVSIRGRADSGQAVIEVADTGPGIAPEHHERLFERFYRVDRARSRELGGTGLGLSIVKHLCQAMGGSVAVESSLKKGSVFRVRLPLA
jgi:two-component system phosphate regulon sensor histidine kinase PhoR